MGQRLRLTLDKEREMNDNDVSRFVEDLPHHCVEIYRRDIERCYNIILDYHDWMDSQNIDDLSMQQMMCESTLRQMMKAFAKAK